MRRLTLISTPLFDDVYGRRCLLDSIERGECPVHYGLLFQHYGKTEASKLITECAEMIAQLTLTVVFYVDRGWSEDMEELRHIAERRYYRVEHRHIKNHSAQQTKGKIKP